MSRLRAVVPALLGVTLGSTMLVSTADAQSPASTDASSATVVQARRAMPAKSVWLSRVRKSLHGAIAELNAAVATAKDPSKLAIVLDIDNTSIQTHYNWPKPVKPTRKVANHAAALGMHVFFVTGRTASQIKGLDPILFDDGYRYDRIYPRPAGMGLAASKQANRAKIVKRGFTIVMDIGNRHTDMVGADTGIQHKLPSLGGRLS